MASLLSIKSIYTKHRQENPGSSLSERTIRQAVKNGELPAIYAGNRALICDEVFENWLRGELQTAEDAPGY